MRNITLSAKEELIERARKVANERQTTLNQMFRDWLESLESGDLRSQNYRYLMEKLDREVEVGGRPFSRKEMYEC